MLELYAKFNFGNNLSLPNTQGTRT